MWKKSIVFLSILFILSACSLNQGQQPRTDYNPSKYTPTETDVVESLDGIKNITLLEKFIENVHSETPDKIRVVKYTTEGDAIILDVEYKGKVNYNGKDIFVKTDSTRDKFGPGEIDNSECKGVGIKELSDSVEYELTGCESMNIAVPLITVDK